MTDPKAEGKGRRSPPHLEKKHKRGIARSLIYIRVVGRKILRNSEFRSVPQYFSGGKEYNGGPQLILVLPINRGQHGNQAEAGDTTKIEALDFDFKQSDGGGLGGPG